MRKKYIKDFIFNIISFAENPACKAGFSATINSFLSFKKS